MRTLACNLIQRACFFRGSSRSVSVIGRGSRQSGSGQQAYAHAVFLLFKPMQSPKHSCSEELPCTHTLLV